MARPARFERATAWFVARYSIQLSYGRVGVGIMLMLPIYVKGKSVKTTDKSLPTFPGNFEKDGIRFMDVSISKYGGERGIRTLDGAINPILP